ncbi:MAG: GNAT family N-acetyltransferase [Thermoplasmata archaeon]|nr:GNAT family N-acetyltransferase [Thermoplasmata archaeon]
MSAKIVRLRSGQEAEVVRAAHLFDEPPDPTAIRDYLDDDRNVFYLAFEVGRPVGFLRGSGLGQLKSTRRQMFLYEIAVDPPHRRQGVARLLIEALLQYCRARGFEEVFVFTDPSNDPAVGLYRTTGAVTETPADRMFVYRL